MRMIAPAARLVGGIHPPEEKSLSNGTPIASVPMPDILALPLSQHTGAPSEVVVSEGTRVLRGQPIAEAAAAISVALHAPTSGIIRGVTQAPVAAPGGQSAPCLLLEPDGKDERLRPDPDRDWRQSPSAVLLEILRNSGIAGMGGAGFPTAVKAALRHEGAIDTLIINASECEPYITADDRLMRERAPGILRGIDILMHLLKPERCLIGIEDNKPEAIAALETAIGAMTLERPDDIHIVAVPTRYPSGGEKQLIQILTGREVPSGGLPADVGIVCQNVGSAWAIHDAIHHGNPLVSRVVTVTGRAVARPGNYEVLLGTPFAHLLDHAGLDEGVLHRLIMGGPMMGFAVHDAAVPVVKTTNCVLAGTAAEFPEAPPQQACIRCGMCAEACPASLLPQQLYWHAQAHEYEQARSQNLFDCIECGACAWVCPSSIPLVQYYRHAKAELRQIDADTRKADKARLRFEHHQARIEAENAEREAKRAARAAAAREKAAARKARASGDSDPVRDAVARASGGTPEKAAELVQRKIQTLSARLEKARASLDEARDAADADRERLFASKVSDLQTKIEKAQAELSELGAARTPAATPTEDPNVLRGQLANLEARLEKTRSALADAGEDDRARLKSREEDLVRKVDKLREKLAAHPEANRPEPPEVQEAEQATATSPDLNALAADLAKAEKRMHAARKALEDLLATGTAPETKLAAMRSSLEKLEQRAQEAQEALDEATTSAATQTADAERVESDDADREALETAARKARGRADAARKALADLEASGNAAAAKLEAMRASLEKLEQRAQDAEAERDA